MYAVYSQGAGNYAKQSVAYLSKSGEVKELAKKLGLKEKLTGSAGRLLGGLALVLIGFNAMASHSAKQAKNELRLRGMIDVGDF